MTMRSLMSQRDDSAASRPAVMPTQQWCPWSAGSRCCINATLACMPCCFENSSLYPLPNITATAAAVHIMHARTSIPRHPRVLLQMPRRAPMLASSKFGSTNAHSLCQRGTHYITPRSNKSQLLAKNEPAITAASAAHTCFDPADGGREACAGPPPFRLLLPSRWDAPAIVVLPAANA
jgi:hypothetical protein